MATSWLFSRRFGGHIPAWASVCPFIHILSGFSVVLVALMTMTPVQAQTTSATYTVTFQGNWTLDSTPDGVVGGAHFTTLVGAVHNDMVTFWESGGTATSGVEGVAELGSTGTFASEVAAAGANASLVTETIGSSPTVTATFEIEVTSDHPLFTLLSMIGPSPDWFVGVSGLSLLDAQNQWVSSREVDLFPYDAGTEDGDGFSLSNPATDPRGTITSIKGTGKFSDEPMAMLSFELQGTEETPGSGGGGGGDGGGGADVSLVSPSNLAASHSVADGKDVIRVTWTRPQDVEPIEYFEYRVREGYYVDVGDNHFGPEAIPWTRVDKSEDGVTIDGLSPEVRYLLTVRSVYGDGRTSSASRINLPVIPASTVSISSGGELPAEVTLGQNYPNPFNPETTIRYGLPKAGEVRLAVYNLLGHEVAILVDQSKPAGHHTVRFGAGNLPSGVYVYRLHAGDETIVRTMMLVK